MPTQSSTQQVASHMSKRGQTTCGVRGACCQDLSRASSAEVGGRMMTKEQQTRSGPRSFLHLLS